MTLTRRSLFATLLAAPLAKMGWGKPAVVDPTMESMSGVTPFMLGPFQGKRGAYTTSGTISTLTERYEGKLKAITGYDLYAAASTHHLR